MALLFALVCLYSLWSASTAQRCPGPTAVLPAGVTVDPCSPPWPARHPRRENRKRTNNTRGVPQPACTPFSNSLTAPSIFFDHSAWSISFGAVAQRFRTPTPQLMTSATIYLWIEPGGALTSVDFTVFQDAACGDSPGATVVTSGTISSPFAAFVVVFDNGYGFNVWQTELIFPTPVPVAPGNCYWLRLENAVASPLGTPIYWDATDQDCAEALWESGEGASPNGECAVNLQLCGDQVVLATE